MSMRKITTILVKCSIICIPLLISFTCAYYNPKYEVISKHKVTKVHSCAGGGTGSYVQCRADLDNQVRVNIIGLLAEGDPVFYKCKFNNKNENVGECKYSRR